MFFLLYTQYKNITLTYKMMIFIWEQSNKTRQIYSSNIFKV